MPGTVHRLSQHGLCRRTLGALCVEEQWCLGEPGAGIPVTSTENFTLTLQPLLSHIVQSRASLLVYLTNTCLSPLSPEAAEEQVGFSEDINP